MPWSADTWQIVGLVLLALCIATAVVTDLRCRRVPNTLVLSTLMLGFALNIVGPSAQDAGGLFSAYPGALGLTGSLGGAAVGLLLFLPFYALRAMGAGDVKFFAAVGSFSGALATINMAPLVWLAGGVLALLRMYLTRSSAAVLQNAWTMAAQMGRAGASTVDAKTQTAWRMPYALAIAGGVASYAAWILSGHLPWLKF